MQREIESTIADRISRFAQEYMGRSPKHIDTHLLGDLLIVRFQGMLASAEKQLANGFIGAKGRDLLKRAQAQLIEATRPVLEALVEEATGTKVVSLHHDVSTVTGEKVVVFTLAEAPEERAEARPK